MERYVKLILIVLLGLCLFSSGCAENSSQDDVIVARNLSSEEVPDFADAEGDIVVSQNNTAINKNESLDIWEDEKGETHIVGRIGSMVLSRKEYTPSIYVFTDGTPIHVLNAQEQAIAVGSKYDLTVYSGPRGYTIRNAIKID